MRLEILSQDIGLAVLVTVIRGSVLSPKIGAGIANFSGKEKDEISLIQEPFAGVPALRVAALRQRHTSVAEAYLPA